MEAKVFSTLSVNSKQNCTSIPLGQTLEDAHDPLIDFDGVSDPNFVELSDSKLHEDRTLAWAQTDYPEARG